MNKLNPAFKFAAIMLAIVMIVAGFYLIKPIFTGSAVQEKENVYVDRIGQEFISSSEYGWQSENAGLLKSFRISGAMDNSTAAKIYLESDGTRYLVFDTLKQESDNEITGFVVDENGNETFGNESAALNETAEEPQINETNATIDETIINETTSIINETQNNETIINETISITNETLQNNETILINDSTKSININLKYNDDSFYDENNDGKEFVTNVIDFSVKDTEFGWDADKAKACTKWEVYSIDSDTITRKCSGNNECCALIRLLPQSDSWDDNLYLSYNSLGATYNNIVNAQVIYSDVNELVYSNWSNLSAEFREEGLVEFNNKCDETCALPSLNNSNYKIIVEMESGKIILNNVTYTVSQKEISNAPVLIADLPNYTINQNELLQISLSSYFNDPDNDSLEYGYYKSADNIFVEVADGIMNITPYSNFTGTAYMFITANDSESSVSSNVFSIKVVSSNVTFNITPNIILDRKDFKLDENIDAGFEYLTKNELVKENKWKEEYDAYEEKSNKTKEEKKILKERIAKKEKQKKKWQTASEVIEASVVDSDGASKDIDVDIEELREGKFSIKLAPPRSFKAGKYTLRLNLVKDGVTYNQEQDFTWGVLALNLNKSIYLENDNAFVSIGVLDDAGKIVCNANITLKIVDPSNYTTTLMTSDGSIKISPECEVLGVTSLPDYYADYSVKDAGEYAINLTAVTYNGIRTVTDGFNVTDSVDFDVARNSATRVYPKALYTMDISVVANENYNGVVKEYVPASFAVVPQNGLTVSIINDTSILSWDVKLKKDEKIKLSYQYDAPDVSPEFYLLGPLDIGKFFESRQWQIANDAASDFNYTYPDAGAPGMNLVVSIVGTGFASSDTVVTNSSGNITVGPIIIVDANGSRVDSLGKVLSTVFYIHPNATAQDVQVNISGVSLPSVFKIIVPTLRSGNFSNAAAGVYMIGNGKNGTRTVRGTIVLDSLIIPSNVKIVVNTTDLDPTLAGDQGYLPVTIIVNGPVNISGILNVSGSSALAGASDNGGNAGNGGPGGGGGGGGSADAGNGGSGGNGFTGGGGGAIDNGAGGVEGLGGNGTGPAGYANAPNNYAGGGGSSISPSIIGGDGGWGCTSGAGGGGGTGFFFGSSGGGGFGPGAAGFGGGGGGGRCAAQDGGGGGFGTNGTRPAGGGEAGGANGNAHLLPLTGGSGGGGGGGGTGNPSGSGGGGGGGGAVLIFADENITITSTGQILSLGGNGGGGTQTGGAGSGGGIVLQAFNVTISGALNTSAGASGTAGGTGRIRVDGLDSPVSFANYGIAGSNFSGPSIKNITDASIGGTANASDNIIVYVKQKSGTNTAFTGTADANGKFDIAVTWYTGMNYIAVIQNSTVNTYTVLSSASVMTYDMIPDTTKPRINASLDDSTPFFTSRVNMTANVSDETALSFCQFIDNMSSTGAKRYFNVTIAGTNDQCSQNYTISLTAGNVINFTVIVNDTAGNINQTTQIVGINSTNLLGCEDLDVPNTQYNLTRNVKSNVTCIYIMANNVTLDCKGFKINYSQSAAGYGVDNTGFNYSTVKSCNIVQGNPAAPSASAYGIYVESNFNNTIYNNTITTSGFGAYGAYLFLNSNNSIHSNTITTSGGNAYSAYLSSSLNNNVHSNTITTSGNSGYGAYLFGGSNNSVYSNNITTKDDGSVGAYLDTSSNNSVYSNNITTSGISADGVSSTGSDNRVYSNNITTSGINAYGASSSVGSNNNIYSNTITTSSSGDGALLSGSNNSVYSNNITTKGSGGAGAYLLSSSSNNSVYNNIIATSGSNGYGVYLDTISNNNNVYSNTITTSNSSSYGIYLYRDVFNNTIYNNNITTNNASGSYGIYLLDNAVNNTFYKNSISSLAIGILINGTDADFSTISKVYSNTFTNDTIVPCSVGCAADYQDIVLTANVTDITFTNVSFNKSRVAFIPRDPSFPTEKNNMTVQWYLTINVTNSTNNNGIPGAQINVNDSFGFNLFNLTSDATGGIGTQTLTEFTMNGSVQWGTNDSCQTLGLNENITCSSPYNMSVNITGYNAASRSLEVNRSMFVNMSMSITSVANTAPVIKLNNATFSADPVTGGNSRILISFNVTDTDGVNTINASKAIVNLTLGKDQFRFNISDQGNEFGTCMNHTQGNVMIINCTIIMKYYDNASSNWVINVSVKDIAGNNAVNDTVTFTYNTLSSISMVSSALNFSTVTLGQQNVRAYPHLLMNNTGNDDFGQVNMTASALTGMTTTTESIAVTNFGVNLSNSSSNSRLSFPADGIINLRDPDTGKNITFRHGYIDAFGPNADKGNISAFIWVNVPSSGLSTQLYNATWNITAINSP